MSKHPIPQALRDQLSAIEDDAASMGSGAQAIFARMRTSVQAFFMEQPAGGAVPDEFAFEYRHANGEHHTVTVSREQVIEQMPDFLFEALCDKFCNCEPIGETNVVECCCDEYAEEFQLLAAAPHPVSGEPFQARVLPWLLECFGQVIADDKTERNHRFLEEALELVQSCGCTEDEAHKLVAYVYGRAVGERSQEVGGVMVTLAALCLAQRLDMHQCGEVELARILQPAMVEKIREKQKRKPAMSPLPGVYPERAQQGEQP